MISWMCALFIVNLLTFMSWFKLDSVFRSSLMNTCRFNSLAGKEALRCLALALKQMPFGQQTLSYDDENDLTFIGLVCFLFKKECLKLLISISNACGRAEGDEFYVVFPCPKIFFHLFLFGVLQILVWLRSKELFSLLSKNASNFLLIYSWFLLACWTFPYVPLSFLKSCLKSYFPMILCYNHVILSVGWYFWVSMEFGTLDGQCQSVKQNLMCKKISNASVICVNPIYSLFFSFYFFLNFSFICKGWNAWST